MARLVYTTPPRVRPLGEADRALLADGKETVVQLREHAMRCWTWGEASAPGVMLVPGWGGGPAFFTPLIERLRREGFRVTSFLGPAHGPGSAKRSTAMTWVHAFRKILEATGPFQALVGHSLGAATIVTAAKLGTRAERIVLLSAVTDLVDNTDGFGARLGLSKKIMAEMRRLIWEEFLEDCAPLGQGWEDLYEVSLDTPTLLIHDEQDPVLDIKHSRSIVERWPNSRLIATSGLGHYKLARQPSTIEEVVAFLKGTSTQ
jgi:pimeloyl-ACP methyl ester carboxylesterase